MEPSFTSLITDTVLTYVPAYFGNMMPPIAAALRLPFGEAIGPTFLGRNKTYRGIYAGIIGGIFGSWLLSVLGLGWYAAQTLPSALLAGGLMGFGALIGDMTKSAIKRWRHIPSGKPFIPFDQLDFILGGSLFALVVMPIPLDVFATALIITPLLHLLVNILAYHLKLKDVWW
jgi:CDP-2,3-bis-(O-geranylgeranyl)-sn-glycerol synthase